MTSTAREKSAEEFRENPALTVFIMSLKVGGVGLNMTASNKVINADLWFNVAIEDQGMKH